MVSSDDQRKGQSKSFLDIDGKSPLFPFNNNDVDVNLHEVTDSQMSNQGRYPSSHTTPPALLRTSPTVTPEVITTILARQQQKMLDELVGSLSPYLQGSIDAGLTPVSHTPSPSLQGDRDPPIPLLRRSNRQEDRSDDDRPEVHPPLTGFTGAPPRVIQPTPVSPTKDLSRSPSVPPSIDYREDSHTTADRLAFLGPKYPTTLPLCLYFHSKSHHRRHHASVMSWRLEIQPGYDSAFSNGDTINDFGDIERPMSKIMDSAGPGLPMGPTTIASAARGVLEYYCPDTLLYGVNGWITVAA